MQLSRVENRVQGRMSDFMKKAVFLDRDGVINKGNALTSASQLELIENAPEAVKKINDAGFLAIVVTNQPGIAKGFCTFDELDRIHEKMKKLLGEKGARLDAVYICPHHPEKGFDGEVKELKIDCDCRKPKPGLMLKAASELDVDLSQSWMIGDSETDIEAGKSAGAKTVLISDRRLETGADIIRSNLLEAVEAILNG